MKFILLCIALVFANSSAKSFEQPKNCTQPGLLCETCSSLVACISNGEENWKKVHVETCSSGTKCLKGKCTKDLNPICDGAADLAFPCKHVGIYPDPFYCNKFVMCVNVNGKLLAYGNECESGLAYNIGTGLCDIQLENGSCDPDTFPLPLCTKLGQAAPLPDKPQEYYTCKMYSATSPILYPFIDLCPQGAKYEDFQCQF